jgi:hypothetical protein
LIFGSGALFYRSHKEGHGVLEGLEELYGSHSPKSSVKLSSSIRIDRRSAWEAYVNHSGAEDESVNKRQHKQADEIF